MDENEFTFTEAKIRALPLPEASKRAAYRDAKQPGLQLRVTAAGAKTFSVYRRVRGGDAERVTLGRWPDITVEDARRLAAGVVAKLATAESPAAARRALRAEMTLGALFEEYLADRIKAGKRRPDLIRGLWELYLGPLPAAPRKKHATERVKPEEGVEWSRKRLSEINVAMVSQLHRRICAAGKERTANKVVGLVHAMYGYASDMRLVTDNPAVGVTLAPEKDRSRFLVDTELPRFTAALEAEHQPWRDYFTVLLYVGYRRATVAAMRWQDLDLVGGVWHVPGEKAKNGDPIVLPLVGLALTTLKARHAARESNVWVFPGGGRDGHITQPKKAWNRLLVRAKLEDLRIHDLRRTLGSWLAMSNVSLPAIGRALGHKDSRSTAVYARLQTKAVAGVVQIAHDAMSAAHSKAKEG
ncbi:site-specific integrase [Paraburkholderia tropica]|uniref:tyrosine-type recombinase/integrase n=1 Tax=Paraburkholderia tropica TaxID=92647 RepID=UPI0032B3B671